MKLDLVRTELQAVAGDLENQMPDVRWYLFGSVADGNAAPGDVDLLIVYQHETEPALIRKALSELMASMPIHLLFMDEGEERELDGVATQKAVLIYPV